MAPLSESKGRAALSVGVGMGLLVLLLWGVGSGPELEPLGLDPHVDLSTGSGDSIQEGDSTGSPQAVAPISSSREDRRDAYQPDLAVDDDMLRLLVNELTYKQIAASEGEPGAVELEEIDLQPAAGAKVRWLATKDAVAEIRDRPELAWHWAQHLANEDYRLLVDPEQSPFPEHCIGHGVTDAQGYIPVPSMKGNLIIAAEKGKQSASEILSVDPDDRHLEMTLELRGLLRIDIQDVAGNPAPFAPIDSVGGMYQLRGTMPTVANADGRFQLSMAWTNTGETAEFLVGYGEGTRVRITLDDLNGPPVVVRLDTPAYGIIRAHVQAPDGTPLPGNHPVELWIGTEDEKDSFSVERRPNRRRDGVLEWHGIPLGHRLKIWTLRDHVGEELIVPPLTPSAPVWTTVLKLDVTQPLLAIPIQDAQGRPAARCWFEVSSPGGGEWSIETEEIVTDDKGVLLLKHPVFAPEIPPAYRCLDLMLGQLDDVHLTHGGMSARVYPPPQPQRATLSWTAPHTLQPDRLLLAGTVIGGRFGVPALGLVEWQDHGPNGLRVELDPYTNQGSDRAHSFRIYGPAFLERCLLEVGFAMRGTKRFGPFLTGPTPITVQYPR